ncbi:hypothetical protein F5Y17DRAFT_458962 [Xylariaceae sp. FL0594]|nr:hypothetical protein F5Y17DRAFT_458962 [Xylariaceae sp. FL0594]
MQLDASSSVQARPWSAAAKLTTHTPTKPFHDRYDIDELPSATTPDQRQQRSTTPQSPILPSPPSAAKSTPASQRRLRRTPNFSDTPSPRPEARPNPSSTVPVTVTTGFRDRNVLTEDGNQRQRSGRPKVFRQLSQGNLSPTSATTSASFRRPIADSVREPEERDPHPALRISKNTHNAILYALEATLRGPNPISFDPVEYYSQMADLMGGRGSATANGNGASSLRAPPNGPAAAGSITGIRSPTVIMKERLEREARKRERERQERAHLENEARLQEQAEQREAERRASEKTEEMRRPTAAGAEPPATDTDPNNARRQAQTMSGRTPADTGARIPAPAHVPTGAPPQAPPPTRGDQAASRPAQGASGPSATGATAGAQQGSQPQPTEYSPAVGRGRNSFPHAFERWETLSAHWEGLTSFWIRRLEQNAQEIQNDPIAQQLSRQVTDLSSAGANLFHAVVELQRLRASSERKFQRWFMETRSELERNQEVTAMLEAALEEERRSRADAIRQAVEQEQGTSKLHKQLAEMRKELTISKEEARRAWEELGRREQEERDRTTSLQLGHPTIVGGVQVVPMTQGVSRGNTQREQREPRYTHQEMSDYTQSPTSRNARQDYAHVPAVQSAQGQSGSNPVLETPSSVHHQQSYGSEGTMSEEEFETPATQPGAYHAPGPVPQQPQYSSVPDYSGSGYSASGWEEMQPRHHHPTRLSDVLEEEEERSRTSASQLSRY